MTNKAPDSHTHQNFLFRTACVDPEMSFAYCEDLFRKGSLSFYFAAKKLSKDRFADIVRLYAWCRHCDDTIDQNWQSSPPEEKLARWKVLLGETELCFQTINLNHPVFLQFSILVHRYDIPLFYATELLEGMRMDIDKATYRSMEDLLEYSYRVASVVGLMCCHILGIRDEKDLIAAESMGHAMQLTNIVRDIREDLSVGRLFLPEDLLEKAMDSWPEDTDEQKSLYTAGCSVLKTADLFYERGREGIPSLPPHAQLAVAVASEIYQKIGVHYLDQGYPSGLLNRMHTSGWEKMKAFFYSWMKLRKQDTKSWYRCAIRHTCKMFKLQ